MAHRTFNQNITNMSKLIPAPIDGKNVMTDWIEEIFDEHSCIVGGKQGEIRMGFVDNRPVTCFVSGNAIFWHINKWMCGIFVLQKAYRNLIKRLREHDTPPLVVKYDTSMVDDCILMQRFFFEAD